MSKTTKQAQKRRQFHYLSVDSKSVNYFLVTILLLLIGAGFAQSAAALAASGIWLPEWLRWAVPVGIDAAILLGTWVALVLKSRTQATWYPWLVVTFATLYSMWANASHALDLMLVEGITAPRSLWTNAILAGAPPLLIFVGTHMLSLVVVEPAEEAATLDVAKAALVREKTVPVQSAPRPIAVAMSVDDQEIIERIQEEIIKTGKAPTGREVASWIGPNVSNRTGERRIAKAKQALEELNRNQFSQPLLETAKF